MKPPKSKPRVDDSDFELAVDRAERRWNQWRRLFFVPPFLAFFIVLLSQFWLVARPQTVLAIAGAPAPSQSVYLRFVTYQTLADAQGRNPLSFTKISLSADSWHHQATTDAEGVGEALAPIPASPLVVRNLDHANQPILLQIPPNQLQLFVGPPPQKWPLDSKCQLRVRVQPELGAVVFPQKGVLLVEVVDCVTSKPVNRAEVSLKIEAGATPNMQRDTTDSLGLASFELELVSPPLLVTVDALDGEKRAQFRGQIAGLMGAPVPKSAVVHVPIVAFAMLDSDRYYYDVWDHGLHVGGGSLVGPLGVAVLPDRPGFFDVEVSPEPLATALGDDAHHAIWSIAMLQNVPVAKVSEHAEFGELPPIQFQKQLEFATYARQAHVSDRVVLGDSEQSARDAEAARVSAKKWQLGEVIAGLAMAEMSALLLVARAVSANARIWRWASRRYFAMTLLSSLGLIALLFVGMYWILAG
jgi:hypothetical protein